MYETFQQDYDYRRRGRVLTFGFFVPEERLEALDMRMDTTSALNVLANMTDPAIKMTLLNVALRGSGFEVRQLSDPSELQQHISLTAPYAAPVPQRDPAPSRADPSAPGQRRVNLGD